MKVRFLNLSVGDPAQKKEMINALDEVLTHGVLINGPELQAFEALIAETCSRKYAVGVNSGTDALFLALKCLDIGPGDEVITTSLSWIATANAIAMTGATPVFADIGDDLNIDPKSVKNLLSDKTKAILPVHYTGRICNMEKLLKIADSADVSLIEDAAQAFGAKRNEQAAGSFGALACFSFNAMKVFSSLGEAGAILTDKKEDVDRIESLRYNGTINKEVCIEPGLNARMDTIQAAFLLQKFKYVERIIHRRREIAAQYNELLKDIVDLPQEQPDEYNVYYTYTIQTDFRDELQSFLMSKGVETKIQHPFLMPEQPAYKEKSPSMTENAQRIVKRILCIPANEKTTDEEVEYVARQIKLFMEAQ